MKLKDLLAHEKDYQIKGTGNPEIKGITTFSKAIKPQEIYIAYKGTSFDGRDFLQEAVHAKAACVVTDIYNPLINKKLLQIITKDPKAFGMRLAMRFYPLLETLIGVTGTNGKTTVSFCIQQLLKALDYPCALMGTCITDTLAKIENASLTTPDGISFSKLIAESKQAGAKALVSEVSSHALDQKRLLGQKFKVTIFTNLTHDHLDYHKTFEAYQEAKLKLFLDEYRPEGDSFAVINLDDPFSAIIQETTKRHVLSYSLKDNTADLYLENLEIFPNSMKGNLHYKNKVFLFQTTLMGAFNASNLLACLAAGLALKFKLEAMLDVLPKIQGAPGRLEKVKDNIFIDYAHTPDGLESVLKTLKQLPFEKIKVVFGCGGDRDKTKRPEMAKIAESLADSIIVTSDNPRNENPESIIEDIKQGLIGSKETHFIVDRKEALKFAVTTLDHKTILLIAGKGHEKVQIIGQNKIPFDENEIVAEFLRGYQGPPGSQITASG